MKKLQGGLAALLLFLTLFTGIGQAAAYEWNMYSSSMQYIATGQQYSYKSCGSVKNSAQGHYRLPNTTSAQTLATWKVGSGNIALDFGDCSTYGITHILSRHVPEQFIGNITRTQSFFRPGQSIASIQTLVSDTINANKTQIAASGYTSSGTAVYGSWNGNKVKLVIKGGKVITMYPDGWGLGQDLR
ncbi:hypothetical protein GJU40_12835 [Bacillus lacus]|uniref:Bacterial EndoU nuclease domain-containing protein n=1 Tax=Metabacillus lacus TaxID=1983721 RepID=A0A7X2M0E0_9BACI|nr:hypothetical protein [Metabacillus lacus]MRX73027.1 hypothetical protein [Metabacillus lacus]